MKPPTLIIALVLILGATLAYAGELTPEVRQAILDAGLTPYNGRQISLDEEIRAMDGTKVRLRDFLNRPKPMLIYEYAVW